MLRKENIPDIPTSLLKEVARYSHRGAGRFNGFWAGGDSLVLNHRAGNTGQIHLWQPGEPIRQLTRQDEPVAEILCHPSREQLVFSRDQGGDEQFHLFLLRGERGDTVPISSSKSKHGNLVGSPCGRYFAFSATSANGRDFNIHAAAWDKPHRPRLLLSRPGWWVPLSFSPRAQRLLVKQIISARRSRLAILDLESG